MGNSKILVRFVRCIFALALLISMSSCVSYKVILLDRSNVKIKPDKLSWLYCGLVTDSDQTSDISGYYGYSSLNYQIEIESIVGSQRAYLDPQKTNKGYTNDITVPSFRRFCIALVPGTYTITFRQQFKIVNVDISREDFFNSTIETTRKKTQSGYVGGKYSSTINFEPDKYYRIYPSGCVSSYFGVDNSCSPEINVTYGSEEGKNNFKKSFEKKRSFFLPFWAKWKTNIIFPYNDPQSPQ